VHFPEEAGALSLLESRTSAAHRRFALEELYALQRAFARSRRLRDALEAVDCPTSPPAREILKASAPFTLTGDQAKALEAILDDLGRRRPMRRLLLGDVGCGKTLVVLLAARAVTEQGGQVALMVPTEILAEQHHRQAVKLLGGTGHEIALLTSQTKSRAREELLSGIAAGRIQFVIGTHALIQEAVRFRRLAWVVVDEQHRFGVRQRALLRGKGAAPHELFMTATPIPRTLAHAFYGDLDVTRIEEMPPGRKPVRTLLKQRSQRDEVDRIIRQEVEGGGRVAIVLPAIAAGRISPEASALETYRRVSTGVFSDLGVGLLHGKLTPAERRRILQEFTQGSLPILVATTVVEVGLDVPEASGVVIERAERFGLSQLHQIRGRVGRGARSSWCILVPAENASPQILDRLLALTEISDGFEIARRDLELRGAGELLGLRQSGIPDLRIADLPRDFDLLEIARVEAFRNFEES
jgi:ATP-dependent DNA helicase RecG